MKTKVLFIITLAIVVIFVSGILLWSQNLKHHQNQIFDGAELQTLIDENNKCPEKLYGVLLNMRQSSPEIFDATSEVARVKNFTCQEYLTFLKKSKDTKNPK